MIRTQTALALSMQASAHLLKDTRKSITSVLGVLVPSASHRLSMVLLGSLLFALSHCHAASEGAELQQISKAQLLELLDQNQDKAILLHYWATWCRACKEELTELASLQQKYGKTGLEVIFVSIDDPLKADALSRVARYYKEAKVTDHAFISKEKDVKQIMTVVDRDWLGIVPVSYLLTDSAKNVRRYPGKYSLIKLKRDLRSHFASY